MTHGATHLRSQRRLKNCRPVEVTTGRELQDSSNYRGSLITDQGESYKTTGVTAGAELQRDASYTTSQITEAALLQTSESYKTTEVTDERKLQDN